MDGDGQRSYNRVRYHDDPWEFYVFGCGPCTSYRKVPHEYALPRTSPVTGPITEEDQRGFVRPLYRDIVSVCVKR